MSVYKVAITDGVGFIAIWPAAEWGSTFDSDP